MKRSLFTIPEILLVTAVMFLFSCSNGKTTSEIYAPDGIAIRGYDPVAFFEESRPVEGETDYSYEWKGATWLFSSAENLEAFKADPEKYAPQFGGYCAYGASDGEGHKAPTETDTWSIIDDKLYFNYNLKVKERWEENREERIQDANENWPKIKDDEF